MAIYSSGGDAWSIPGEEKVKHEKLFLTLNPIHGKVSGDHAKKCFMKSNLPSPVLGQIWSLSDMDKDGRMTQQEFTIAMHLIHCKLKGMEIPRVLPNALKTSSESSSQVFPAASASFNQPPLQPTMMGSSSMMMNGGMPPMGMIQPMQYGYPGSVGYMATPPMMNQMAYGAPPHIPASNFNTPQPVSFTPQTSFSSTSVNQPKTSKAFDSFALDSLQGFANIATTSKSQTLPTKQSTLGNISASNRMKYIQMFKAADSSHAGFLHGEQARQILIQSNISPQLLAQIWDLSDINQDGRLEADEFIIAMHLIDSSKLGIPIPPTLPQDIIPPHLKHIAAGGVSSGGLVRSDSATSRTPASGGDTFANAASFEDRRKMNWDKGQQELERRRRELQERQQKQKDERERKEREEEERKRRLREEAEQKRLQDLENQRRQKEELEREQEVLRKRMIEERLAAQLEAERQRQREWESRRKEELLNHKGLEENIVNELKNRLVKLKAELASETSSRDELLKNFELKKAEGRELHAAIESIKISRSKQMKNISRLQLELTDSTHQLSSLIRERETYMMELNRKDSTTTSEALGGIRSSIQQMSMGIDRLRKTVLAIESETAHVVKDASTVNQQQREIKVLFEKCLRTNNQLKDETTTKRKALLDAKNTEEINVKRNLAQKLKQEEMRKKLENDLRKQKEREEEAMRKEQQIQKTTQKQRLDAGIVAQRRDLVKQQAEEALKSQQNLLRSQDAQVQMQQDVLSNTKVPPPRPRARPQGSPTKSALSFDADIFQSSATTQPTFKADFGSFDSSPSTTKGSSFDVDFNTNFNQEATILPPAQKLPPARPTPPRPTPPKITKQENTESSKDRKISVAEQKKKDKENEKRKKEEEKRRKKESKTEEADRKRLEKEKQEIERLKKEQEDKDEEMAKQIQIQEENRLKAEQDKVKRSKYEHERMEKEKEDEKLRKDAEVKKRVEEMQRKKMEKKNAAVSTKPTQEQIDPPIYNDVSIAQYVKKVPYKMVFPFEARNQDELSLSEGNIVMVDENDKNAPPGWMSGTFNGNSGLFPANYASKMQNDNFSDYVDLDPRANVLAATTETPATQKKITPRPIIKETPAEVMPKLKPVARPPQPSNTNRGTQPKAALLPSGPLKPITVVAEDPQPRQRRTSSLEDNSDLFPRYDYVATPTLVKEDSMTLSQNELYAVPNKEKSQSRERLSEVEHQPQVFEEDMYQVPGEIIAAGDDSFYVISLYPYRAKKEEHLSFDKNDTIHVQQQQDQWWYGESKGMSGWFPKSYVKTLPGSSVPAVQSQPSIDKVPTVVGSSNEKQAEVEECTAIFEYVQGQPGDLTFYEGDTITIVSKDGEWWEGECKGKQGMFPANYVQVKEKPAAGQKIEKLLKAELASVVVKYVALGSGEINLNVGQLVHVVQKNENGWWEGELQVRGKNKPKGWFPSANVKLKIKSDTPVAKPSPPQPSPPQASQQAQEVYSQEDIYSVPVKRQEMNDKVLALFSYTAQNEDELTFYKGSVIKVISKDGEWWKGELNKQVGVFPYNYVQDLRSDTDEMTSQWSGSFDVNLLKSMSRTEQQRQNHIYELINTEQDYMNDLSLTLEVFYNPMAEGNILTEQELHTVFVNLKELIMCNMKFLKALLVRKKMSETDKIEGIGDILIEQLPRFSPYTRFCSCLVNACRLLQDKVEKDMDFKTFEKQCAGDSRLKQNLPLSSYLLKPLQRITKYPLIISGILKYTPEDHFDRSNLESALEKAEDLCSAVNEGVGSQENSNRLEWLQERVQLEGLEEDLVFNSQTNCVGHRKFLHHGTLHKHKSNKELKAFLFNDFLMLCRVQSGHFKSSSTFGVFHPDNVTQFTIYKKPIFLNEIIVKNPSDPDANELLFHLSHIDRVYSFRCETKNDRNAWVSAIQRASQGFIETERDRRNRASRARSLGEFEVARLVVTIIAGADLQASDPNGTSDPYCEVSMGSQEHKTKVIPKDINPKWNSTMVFNVKDMEKDVLCISVFDRDFFSPNDFLGRTEISVASIAKEGFKPITKRLLLHEVSTGEIVLTLEMQNLKM